MYFEALVRDDNYAKSRLGFKAPNIFIMELTPWISSILHACRFVPCNLSGIVVSQVIYYMTYLTIFGIVRYRKPRGIRNAIPCVQEPHLFRCLPPGFWNDNNYKTWIDQWSCMHSCLIIDHVIDLQRYARLSTFPSVLMVLRSDGTPSGEVSPFLCLLFLEAFFWLDCSVSLVRTLEDSSIRSSHF